MFEIGTSFATWEKKWSLEQAQSIDDFPKLQAMLLEAMRMLTGQKNLSQEDPGGSSLNAICRMYSKDQGIPMHSDRQGDFGFTEDVFGCILANTSDQVLEFEGPDFLYWLDESPGVCLHQKGEARYKWKHGVPPLSRGTRISVLWRWFACASDPAPTFQFCEGGDDPDELTLREAQSPRPSESVIIPETWSFRKPQAKIPAAGLSAQAFTASIYDLSGRPLKSKKHLPPEATQQHLGLVNDFTRFP